MEIHNIEIHPDWHNFFISGQNFFNNGEKIKAPIPCSKVITSNGEIVYSDCLIRASALHNNAAKIIAREGEYFTIQLFQLCPVILEISFISIPRELVALSQM